MAVHYNMVSAGSFQYFAMKYFHKNLHYKNLVPHNSHVVKQLYHIRTTVQVQLKHIISKQDGLNLPLSFIAIHSPLYSRVRHELIQLPH